MNDNEIWPPAPQTEPAPHPDIVLYPSRWKMALIALGGLLFVLCAPLLWTRRRPLSSGRWPSPMCCSSASAPCSPWAACSGRDRPWSWTERGVTDNASATGAGFIAWEEIAAVGLTGFGTNRFLVIIPARHPGDPRPPAAVQAQGHGGEHGACGQPGDDSRPHDDAAGGDHEAHPGAAGGAVVEPDRSRGMNGPCLPGCPSNRNSPERGPRPFDEEKHGDHGTTEPWSCMWGGPR